MENAFDPQQAFADRLRRALAIVGGNQSRLADLLETNQSNLSKWLSGVALPNFKNKERVDARLMEIEERHAHGEALKFPRYKPRGRAAANAEIGERVAFSRRRIPVLGEAVGGADGRFIMNGQHVTDVLCPPSLEAVKEAYAVQIRGESMIPRYEPGEVAYANPRRAVKSGDYVVAQISTGIEGEAPEAFVKKFISQSSRELILEQLNPPPGEDRIIRFPRDRVVSVHKIVHGGEG